MRIKQQVGKFAALVALVLAVNLLNPTSASAKTNLIEGTDEAAILFNPLQVNSISLRMTSSDFESLKYPNVSWDNEGDWRRTTMSAVIAGKTYGPLTVGVHLKGAWGSWRDVNGKAAFKVKMDAFVAGQRLLGVSKLTLNNMVQDASMIHEFMTYKLMRSVGLPAPRTGYMDVTLNGINYGLHLNVETISKTMLARWGVTSDHIYKGSLPYFPDFYPGSQDWFKVESGSPPNRDDLANFMAINNLQGENWWQAISQVADMEKMTLQWATEIYATHWDGYLMNKNNYFVNFDKEGKVLMLSWGTDQTWGGAPGYFGYGTLLPTRCMASTSCLNLYYRALVKVAVTAQGLKLGQLAQEVSDAIYNSVLKDPWVRGVDVSNAQNSAIENQAYRNQELNQLVVPWDTTLTMVGVNSLRFTPSEMIYLAPGTKEVIVRGYGRQPAATSSIKILKFKPGLNETTVNITSPSGQQVSSYSFKFYVLTQIDKSVQLTYGSNSTTTNISAHPALKSLVAKLAKAKVVKLTIQASRSASSSQTAKRLKNLQIALKKAGVGTYQLSTETARISSNKLIIKASYQE
ncbi:MAG: hypothetical protein EBR26_01095 [Microbacteriaceae bacterium]|nr:hypothetical protein [Microbacteriaceae bacterium]